MRDPEGLHRGPDLSLPPSLPLFRPVSSLSSGCRHVCLPNVCLSSPGFWPGPFSCLCIKQWMTSFGMEALQSTGLHAVV